MKKAKPSGPTPEEKKKMIKNLIAEIPTVKEELFAYPISWNQVDQVSGCIFEV